MTEPEQDRGEDHAASVGMGVLVVAGGQAAPVLEPVEGAFDDVAVLVVLGVEVQRSATGGALGLAAGDGVGLLRDHHRDAAGLQQVAVLAPGVGLVRAKRGGSGARSAWAQPRDAKLLEKPWQCWGITGLPGRDDDDQREAAAVDQRVGLGRQPAAGTPDAVIVRFVQFVPSTTPILVVR